MMNKKIWTIAAVVAVVVIAIAVLVYLGYSGKLNSLWKGNNIQTAAGQQAAEKAINYINNVILRGNGAATLISVGEENGYYKIKFSLQGNEMDSYITKDGKLFFPEVINLDEAQPEPAEEIATTIGSFSVSKDEICEENGKPIIYFFGAETCPHCRWEYPILNAVMQKFGEAVVYHDNKDKDTEMDVFNKYSAGGIPAIVIGCKYYRVGSGEAVGEAEETKNLTALICKITGSNPAGVCDGVKEIK